MNRTIDEMFQNIGRLEERLHKLDGASEVMNRRRALQVRTGMARAGQAA